MNGFILARALALMSLIFVLAAPVVGWHYGWQDALGCLVVAACLAWAAHKFAEQARRFRRDLRTIRAYGSAYTQAFASPRREQA